MKNRIFNIFLIVSGLFLCFYDAALIYLSPGTFLDNLTSFTHVWLIPGGYLIFTGLYRIKTRHSFWKIWKRWVKITVMSVIGFCFVIAIVTIGFILSPKKCSLNESAEYVILLGGGIDKNGCLPDSVIKRVEKTAEYLTVNTDALCVVTGGTLKWLPYPEAPEIKRQLMLKGISEERILVEDKALDTIQNFQNSVDILQQKTGKSCSQILKSKFVVITSDFHLRRAERLAQRMGFENIKGIAAKTPVFKIPNSYLREIGAYIKLNLRILFTGKPEKLC